MAIEVFFRGVGVFVPQGKDKATEVLFPWAEDTPPDHETDDDGAILHADGTPAIQHYAGVVIVRKGNRPFHERLRHKRVTIADGKGATIDPGSFGTSFPSLALPTERKPLKLLAPNDREGDKVATKIELGTGSLIAIKPPQSQPPFMVDGTHGRPDGPKQYSVAAKWTPENATADVPIVITAFGAKQPEKTIVLSEADQPKAVFYSYDQPLPSLKDLEAPLKCEGSNTVFDHDFKWILQLLKHNNASWKQWLAGERFLPAPHGDCISSGLVPVFSCYQTFWGGDVA